MAVQIILKNSTTEDKRPKTLANGEISLNYHADGAFLCCQDTEGNIQQVGGVKISTDAPDAPVKQTLWFNPDTLTLFIFDGDAWFPVGGAGGGGGGGDIIQIIGNDGIDADTIGGIVTLDVELAGGDDGLEFKTSKLSASIASETVLGSVKIGDNIDVSADGTISVDVPQTTTFRGSCILENPPLGQLAPNPPETGDAYINGVATNSIDNGWVNLGGGASAAGDLVIWDGAEWELIQTGGDSLWQRTGTTLEPTVAGDNIATTGKITSASTEDSDSGTTVVTKDYLGTALDNIPDIDNPANQPGTLDDRYVNVIGDNMTGDLTLGTDKITLDASNGNATFAGKATSASTEDTDSDTTLVTKDYLASEIAEGIDDLDAVTEIIPGDGIDTRETDGEVTVSVYLAGTNDGLEFETGKLKATVATASELGSVMIGDGVNVDADGTISVPEAPSVTTSDTPPLAADSSNGDLWWNTNDGRLYIYYTDGDSSQWVDASPDSETELITNGPSFPTDAEVNDLFFNTTEGRLYIYFDDGNSQQWVDAAPQGSTGEGGGGGGDVERLVAGDNITLSPADGKGVVTISATGGPGGVNYNGASAWGSVEPDGTVKGSYNASVQKTGTGAYTVTFAKPLANSNYSVTATCASTRYNASFDRNSLSPDSFKIQLKKIDSDTSIDFDFCFAVHSENAIAPPSGVGADAWGFGNNSGSTDSTALLNSYNIGSFQNTGTGKFIVTFTSPLPTSNYSVVCNSAQNSRTYKVLNQTLTGFDIEAYSTSSDTLAGTGGLSFQVHASSTVTPTYTWTRDGTTLKPANAGDGVELDSYLTVADFVTSGERNKADSKGGITINGNAGTIEVYGYYNEKVLQIFDNSDNEKIALERSGSATFAGNIQSNWKDGTTFGCELASQGLISVRNDSANDFVFRAYKNTFAEDVAHITNDGSAEFVGGWGNDNGVLIDTNGFNVRADSGRGLGIYSGGNADSNRTISLNGDGSATFAGNIETKGSGPDLFGSFNGERGLKISYASGSSSSTARAVVTLDAQAPTYDGKLKFAIAGTTKLEVDVDTAAFADKVTAPNVFFNLEADDDTKYTATTNAEGEQTLVYNGAVLDVKDRLQKADAALLALKAAAVAATDFASLQAAIVTALADI